MTFISRCVPPEADDPPPAAPTEIASLAAERATLQGQVRCGIRSQRQERILRRIAEITRQMLTER